MDLTGMGEVLTRCRKSVLFIYFFTVKKIKYKSRLLREVVEFSLGCFQDLMGKSPE